MKRIYLIRHAQSLANSASHDDIVQHSNAQIPITALGREQAQKLAIWFKQNIENNQKIDEVFVSPYLRTQQTAEPYLQQTQMTATVLDDLHEFNYLSFNHIQGKKLSELKQLSEQYWQRNDPYFKDGDDCDSFASFFNQISNIRQYFTQKNDGVYIVFGHGFWIGVLLWQLLGRYSGEINMQKFREFELLVRPNNTDVYLWQMDNHQVESMAKVRSCI